MERPQRTKGVSLTQVVHVSVERLSLYGDLRSSLHDRANGRKEIIEMKAGRFAQCILSESSRNRWVSARDDFIYPRQ